MTPSSPPGGCNTRDAVALIERLPLPHGHFLEVRTVVPDARRTRQQFFGSHRSTLRFIESVNARTNIYVGACPRSVPRGTRDAVRFVTCNWADLDLHQIEAADRARAEQIAHDRLARFLHRPTMLVHSGNGLQCWWLYDSPIEISERYSTAWFEAINRNLARALGGDNVHDLARVLRVAGSWNLPDVKKRARGCVPVMARLLYADGPTYRPEDFQSVAINSRNPTTSDLDRSVASRLPPPDQPDQEIIEAFQKLIAELGSRHPLTRTWRGDRSLNDSSRSGWDMALVNQLCSARVREEFIPSIVRAFRHGRGVFATDDYIVRTLAKARARRRSTHEAPRSA